jgi:hypothetical protein
VLHVIVEFIGWLFIDLVDRLLGRPMSPRPMRTRRRPAPPASPRPPGGEPPGSQGRDVP